MSEINFRLINLLLALPLANFFCLSFCNLRKLYLTGTFSRRNKKYIWERDKFMACVLIYLDFEQKDFFARKREGGR